MLRIAKGNNDFTFIHQKKKKKKLLVTYKQQYVRGKNPYH